MEKTRKRAVKKGSKEGKASEEGRRKSRNREGMEGKNEKRKK